MEATQVEEASAAAPCNNITAGTPGVPQRWLQVQDMLGQTQARQVEAQGQRNLRVQAGQVHLGTQNRCISKTMGSPGGKPRCLSVSFFAFVGSQLVSLRVMADCNYGLLQAKSALAVNQQTAFLQSR